ncbi:monovalent cation:proton antiporter, putative [Ricinus communis]|uniref:Monovalent cation:proton antiporter, putative n=1 Tax=Ricinus communis TaxID=3988 RepID=B9S482_RICCO|nr:monovalent cation:proton antiporter, putative [Ricinus communis]
MVHPKICTAYREDYGGHGIFDKYNPLAFTFPVFMLQAIVSLLMCNLVYFALGPWIGSKLVCNILAGVILGPSIMGQINNSYMEKIFSDKEMFVFNTLVKIGTGYYLFLIAVKMDVAMLLRTAKRIPTLSNVLATTYYANIAVAMEEHNLLTSELGRLAMSAGMFMEAVGWVHLILSVIILQGNIGNGIRVVIFLCSMILFATRVVRPVIVKQIIERIPEESPLSENFVVAILICALVMGLIAESTFGAFYIGTLLMGLIIPDGPPLGSALVEKVELMVMEFFQPMFFVLIGYSVDTSFMVHNKDVGLLLLFVVGCHLAKILGTMLATLFININLRNAVLLAISLNIRGVVDLTAYERWHIRGIMDKRMFSILVLSNIFLTGIYNTLVHVFYKPEIRLAAFPPTEKYFRTLQTTPSDKELHILTSTHNEDSIHCIIALLEASYPNAASPINVNVIHAVELAGRAGPKIIPYSSHSYSRKLQSNTAKHIMRAFTNYARNSSGPVSIRPFIMVAPFKTMHNIICNYAEEERIPFIIVPFLGENDPKADRRMVRDFNVYNLQENSPCTVGILVDRGLDSRINLGRFSYSALLIFVGGADDREALRLTTRMSGNPAVSITFMKINLMHGNEDIDEAEEERDKLLIQEFKDKNAYNACVVFRDMIVENTLQLMHMAETLVDIYDLVMVGKMPMKVKHVKEMTEWIDHPELGVIGDALISSKPRDCKMSILVMQHTFKVDKTIHQDETLEKVR